MSTWITSQWKKAEEALESVDRTAKNLKHIREDDPHGPTSPGGSTITRTSLDGASKNPMVELELPGLLAMDLPDLLPHTPPPPPPPAPTSPGTHRRVLPPPVISPSSSPSPSPSPSLPPPATHAVLPPPDNTISSSSSSHVTAPTHDFHGDKSGVGGGDVLLSSLPSPVSSTTSSSVLPSSVPPLQVPQEAPAATAAEVSGTKVVEIATMGATSPVDSSNSTPPTNSQPKVLRASGMQMKESSHTDTLLASSTVPSPATGQTAPAAPAAHMKPESTQGVSPSPSPSQSQTSSVLDKSGTLIGRGLVSDVVQKEDGTPGTQRHTSGDLAPGGSSKKTVKSVGDELPTPQLQSTAGEGQAIDGEGEGPASIAGVGSSDSLQDVPLGHEGVTVVPVMSAGSGGVGTRKVGGVSSAEAKEAKVAAVSSQGDGSESGGRGRGDLRTDLEEARNLVKGAPTVGQSKEARLAKVCERLSQRLGEYKKENEQLEELLAAERKKSSGGAGQLSKLEDEVAHLQTVIGQNHAEFVSAIADKDELLKILESRVESAQRAVAAAEGRTAAVEAEAREMREAREWSEAAVTRQLREDLLQAEQRQQREQQAHLDTRREAEAREAHHQLQAQETARALAATSKEVEERVLALAELERRLNFSENECERMQQELKDAEMHLRREQAKQGALSEEAVAAQIANLKEQLQAAEGAARVAEAGREAAVMEASRLNQDIAQARAEAAQAASKAEGDLQVRFKEVTELLYQKQTQLEHLTTEKAAQQLQFERELSSARSEARATAALVSKKRGGGGGGGLGSGWSENEDEGALVPMESMQSYQRLATHKGIGSAIRQVGKGLDQSAYLLGKLLRQKPVLRVAFFLYVGFIHAFLWLLIHRLQSRVDMLDVDDAASMRAAFDAGPIHLPPSPTKDS